MTTTTNNSNIVEKEEKNVHIKIENKEEKKCEKQILFEGEK